MSYKYPRKSQYSFKVKRSVAGLGLFVEGPIKKGDFVIEYCGPLLNEEEADRKNGKYLFEIDDTWTIDGSGRENIARYINHSCKPNCETEIEGKRLFIYALRSIKAGEELTYDYGKEYFNDFIKPCGCKCGNHKK